MTSRFNTTLDTSAHDATIITDFILCSNKS